MTENTSTASMLLASQTWISSPTVVAGCLTAISTINTWRQDSTSRPQTDFFIRDLPYEGIVLSRPGTYYLTNNVTMPVPERASLSVPQAAIIISSSDVTLDLCGFGITNDNERLEDCIGIVVQSSQRVNITNGFIYGFGIYGAVAVGSHGIAMHGLHVGNMRNGKGTESCIGILLYDCRDSVVSHCKVTDAHVNCGGYIGYIGMAVKLCQNVHILNSAVNNIRNECGSTMGAAIIGCLNAGVHSCSISNVSSGSVLSSASPGHTCAGILVHLNIAAVVQDCRVLHIHGSCDDTHGVAVFVCGDGIRVSRCAIEDVSSGFTKTGTGAKATGVEVISATATTVEDCIVRGVQAVRPQDLQCAAFASGTCRDVEFKRCVGSHVRCLNSEEGTGKKSIGIGFGWGPDPRSIFTGPAVSTRYHECRAEYCDVAFDLFMSISATLRHCIAANVTEFIRNDPTEVRTLTCNACSECVPDLTTAIVNIGRDNTMIT
jgi:hypothetical protein